MRIGCLQFAPQVGEVQNNILRAEDVLAKADSDGLQNLDLLVLPEMALSGYNFKSSEHILPYLEPTASGASSQWARTAARKYDCTVAVGYPEKTEGTEMPEHYNSLVVVNPEGETLANYSKSFLYYTDETWAREGKGFYSGKLDNLGQVAMGICMDINPYKFEAPFTAYEFASHVLNAKANLVILSTAWLTNDERTTFLSCPQQPDLATLTYWARRLEPILRTESPEETIVVIGNRCGIEDDATYAGTSTVMGIKNGEFSLYGILGRAEEQLLVVDTDKPPYAKFTLEPLEELLDGDSEPEIPPPEPTNGPGDGPPKESNPGEGNGYVDSPTLPPSGFLPFIARSHTTSGASTLTDSANKETEKTYLPLPALTATPTTPSRPKLSLVTDLDSVMPFSTSIPAAAAISPPNIHISPPASPSMEPGHQHFSWNPPSAIPIFVDVYTPDAPTWDAKQGLRIDFGIDCLSPWSISSRSCSPFGGGARIPIAVSPSIFGGGFSKRGGVVSPGWIC